MLSGGRTARTEQGQGPLCSQDLSFPFFAEQEGLPPVLQARIQLAALIPGDTKERDLLPIFSI